MSLRASFHRMCLRSVSGPAVELKGFAGLFLPDVGCKTQKYNTEQVVYKIKHLLF